MTFKLEKKWRQTFLPHLHPTTKMTNCWDVILLFNRSCPISCLGNKFEKKNLFVFYMNLYNTALYLMNNKTINLLWNTFCWKSVFLLDRYSCVATVVFNVRSACCCVFKVLTLALANQGNYFENANKCSKRMLKTTVATQLKRKMRREMIMATHAINIF